MSKAREVLADFHIGPQIRLGEVSARKLEDYLRSAGLVVVPVEPTEAMCTAFDDVPWRTLAVGLANYRDETNAAWSAMITASQEDKG